MVWYFMSHSTQEVRIAMDADKPSRKNKWLSYFKLINDTLGKIIIDFMHDVILTTSKQVLIIFKSCTLLEIFHFRVVWWHFLVSWCKNIMYFSHYLGHRRNGRREELYSQIYVQRGVLFNWRLYWWHQSVEHQ